jgi:hypothetical protein
MLLLLPLPAQLPLFPLLLGVAPLLQTDASKAIMHHSPPAVVRSLPSPIKGAIRPDIPPASCFVHQIHSSVLESRCRQAKLFSDAAFELQRWPQSITAPLNTGHSEVPGCPLHLPVHQCQALMA